MTQQQILLAKVNDRFGEYKVTFIHEFNGLRALMLQKPNPKYKNGNFTRVVWTSNKS